MMLLVALDYAHERIPSSHAARIANFVTQHDLALFKATPMKAVGNYPIDSETSLRYHVSGPKC